MATNLGLIAKQPCYQNSE